MPSLKRYIFITIRNRMSVCISFQTRNISLLTVIKHFAIRLLIIKPPDSKNCLFLLDRTCLVVNIWSKYGGLPILHLISGRAV